MSTDGIQGPGEPAAREAGRAGEDPSEAELRAAYEAELSRVTAADMMAQAAVTLLNIGARRLEPLASAPGEEASGSPAAGSGRDLEQARDAIDGARALIEILERSMPQELGPLRDALSRLQMTYAREIQQQGVGAGAGQATAESGADRPAAPRAQSGEEEEEGAAQEEGPPGPGPAEASGRLWVPGR